MENYKICSLFSGCGGLDLGFLFYNEFLKKRNKKNRFKIVWANDFDKAACFSYEKNFKVHLYEDPKEKSNNKDRIFYGDIKIVNFNDAIDKIPIDVVLGGFPCQDFSVLRGDRKERGIKVKRGRLYLEFVRALVKLRPKLFVAENVPGLVSANKGLAYKRIIEDFKHLNNSWNEITSEFSDLLKNDIVLNDEDSEYEILFSEVVDFSRMGVPQRRKRLIIIGLRSDLVKEIEKLNYLHKLKKYVHNFLSQEGSISRFYPLTPMEVFEGKTIEDLDDKYKKIMKEYEDTIKEINSERKRFYVKNVWNQLKFNIKGDYQFLIGKNNINFNRNKPSELSKLVKIDHWTKDDKDNIKEDLSENNINIINWEDIIKTHKNYLEELGFFNNPIESKILEDNSQEILVEQPHVIERMAHIPPNENFKFVWETPYQVVGLMSGVYRRIHPIMPSLTIIGKGGGGTWGYHYKIDRQRLTHRERARLQTFPDNFQFFGKTSEIRAQIGNAVPPLAGKRIAEVVYQVLELLDNSLMASPKINEKILEYIQDISGSGVKKAQIQKQLNIESFQPKIKKVDLSTNLENSIIKLLEKKNIVKTKEMIINEMLPLTGNRNSILNAIDDLKKKNRIKYHPKKPLGWCLIT